MRFEITQRDLFQGAIVRKGEIVNVTKKAEYRARSMRAVDKDETPPWEKKAKRADASAEKPAGGKDE